MTQFPAEIAPKRLAEYRPPPYTVTDVALRISLLERHAEVTARLDVARTGAGGADAELWLDGEELELISVSVGGRRLQPGAYRLESHGLGIPGIGEGAVVETHVRIYPDSNTRLEGLYRSGGNYFTQCEAEGFRRITYFIDRPDVLARYSTTIESDATAFPVLLANGNPVARGRCGTERHWVRWDDPYPKPSYLFAMVAGDLARVEDAFVTGSGRRVSLHAYVMPGQEGRLGPALTALKKAMQWDETNYGREYDLDLFMLVAVPDFNMGAMENKGLNIFNAQYVLADPESATDRDLENIEAVVAHEYFHNWTGNRVTCRDWFQLCLKEGLTVFREQQFVADQGAPAVARLREVKTLRALQFPEDEGPMAHPVRPSTYLEINNFYTPTVYEKGAELIRMLHTLIGAEAFRAGMDLYFQRYDGKAVTVEDLLAVMAEASRRDLGQFQRWYEQAGTPRVRITRDDEEEGRLRLTAEQSIPAAAGQAQGMPLLIPVRLGLIGPDGEVIVPRPQGGGRIEGEEMIWELTQPRQTLVLHGVPRGAVVSVFRRFSAPVRVETDLERSEWIHLLRHDSDDFNRLEAAQTILMELVWAAAEGAMPDETALQALGALLDDSDLQPAVIAEALSLPAFDFLAASVQALDPIALARARLALCAVLGEGLRDRLRRRYDELAGVDEPGARALRGLALAMLAEFDPDGICALAEAQFDRARHMTEILSALELLVAHDPVRAERALTTFYERWKSDDLAVDKWFRVQALAWRDDPVGRVEALLTHRAFDLRRPNRVRSLLGAFAGGNPLGFHASDGSGYRLLAEQIDALMKINPQMAARLTTLLAPWRRMAEPWRGAMREQLEKLARCAPPKDVYEVLSRSLASPSGDAGR